MLFRIRLNYPAISDILSGGDANDVLRCQQEDLVHLGRVCLYSLTYNFVADKRVQRIFCHQHHSILRFVSVAEWKIAPKRSSAFKILIAILEPTMIQIVKLFWRGRSEKISFYLRMKQSAGCNLTARCELTDITCSQTSARCSVTNISIWHFQSENINMKIRSKHTETNKQANWSIDHINVPEFLCIVLLCVFIGGIGQIKLTNQMSALFLKTILLSNFNVIFAMIFINGKALILFVRNVNNKK